MNLAAVENIGKMIISKKKDEINAQIFEEIIDLIDNKKFKEKHDYYSECLLILIEFITLKKYYITYYQITKI